jgi:outer membrane receptor protein involved in Fe transport
VATTAAGPGADNPGPADDTSIKEVVVTGSLIPQTTVELTTPVTTISSSEIQAKGFADIAQALQHTAFATGSIQDGQFLGFTPGAKVASFFGLSPSYTKYLIDGRPIADYPALYNGTDIIVSISGIPTQLIDHIDMLPGAQSSIYGSDAIAGVVNVVMKNKLDGPLVDARYGWTKDGGASDRRIAVADGFSFGSFNLVAGGQYESLTPIWGYQRGLTAQTYNQGTSPQTANRDYLINGLLGDANGNTYYFEDPANCANVASQFGGTVSHQTRAKRGDFCGTVRSGFYTIANGDESTQFYLHATDDITGSLQAFADVLVNHDVVRYNAGPLSFVSSFDSASPLAYFEDPNVGADYLNLQHIFSPEEAGGLNTSTNKNTNNSVRATLGVKGDIGSSPWRYVVDMTYTENKLTESTYLHLTQGIENFFATHVYGPQLGFDSNLGATMYSPNYGAFYSPLTPAQLASFSTDALSYSRTEESYARAQLTDNSLFTLPGGNAGLALQIEGGGQGWDYAPDPRYLDNETFGYTATAGSGHRSRYAGVAELNVPILSMLTGNVSGRYDDFRVAGQSVDKFTYNLGLQLRPIKPVLLRGRYGTAFKAPTLSDEFQGKSGFFQNLNDYYTCAVNGFSGATLAQCPQFQQSVFGVTEGNTKLKPITAKVWDLGFILTPIERLNVTFDYIHWAISNEVQSQDADKLLQTESACRLGQLDITSPTCVAALAQVTRDASGALVQVLTPKQNASQENLGTFIVEANYAIEAGSLGEFVLDGGFTSIKTHTFQQFPGDPVIDYLGNPFYSTEFKTKSNASVTWTKNPVSVTAYVERYGRTPNYISTTQPNGYTLPGAATLPPWTVANLSVGYRVLSSVQLGFAANNVFNKTPPIDHTYTGIETQPYNQFNYNIYGRTYYVTASWSASSN